MDSLLKQLDYILNIETFQIIQDNISKATDMAVITVDFKGHPITKHSNCSTFCKTVRKDKKLSQLCEKCDSRGGLEGVREQKPYIYLCHVGVVDFAIPIVVENQYLGAIMAGQVRLSNIKNSSKLEHIVSKKSQTDISQYPHLRKLYDELHVMDIDKIHAVSQMIDKLINYMVSEAIDKKSLFEINKQLKDTNGVLTLKNSSNILKPSIDYIDKHYKDKIYLKEMASLCNLSPNYFSKRFKREIGISFANYVNTVKIKQAIKILENSDEPIINISLDLGFEDCGYFIKVFKKHQGETPASFRKKCLQ